MAPIKHIKVIFSELNHHVEDLKPQLLFFILILLKKLPLLAAKLTILQNDFSEHQNSEKIILNYLRISNMTFEIRFLSANSCVHNFLILFSDNT